MEVSTLKVENVKCTLGGTQILNGISAEFHTGKLYAIIGPNGSGKSTLLRVMSGEVRASSGSVYYNGSRLDPANVVAAARVRAVLTQGSELSFPLTVDEVVMMGRYPHFSFKPGENDLAICTLALRRMGIEHLRERNYLTLSGGERQMTHFARVLAQVWEKEGEECRFLLLDEPTSSLDLKHQHDFLSIAQGFSREGAVVVVAIHDVNLAAQYADAVFALHHGTILAGGSPEEVLIPAVLDGLYGVKTSVFRDPSLRYPVIVSRQA